MSSSQTIIENLILKPNSKLAQRIVQDAALLSVHKNVTVASTKKATGVSPGMTHEALAWNQRVQQENAAKRRAKEPGQTSKNKNTEF